MTSTLVRMRWPLLVLAASLVGLAALWSEVATRYLASARTADAGAIFERAHATFDQLRAREREALRSQCAILAEDPRLRTTLAIEGIDERTVADILGDLVRIRAAGPIVVLSAEGKVFAQAGAAPLRGADLSGSSVVKQARTSNDAVPGTWVIGGKLIDVSVTAIRLDSTPIAFLVVGRALDEGVLTSVATATGVDLAILVEANAVMSARDDRVRAAVASLAKEPADPQVRAVAGYAVRIDELDTTVQPASRLVIISAGSGPGEAQFERLRWLLWLPPALVLIAVALFFGRSHREIT